MTQASLASKQQIAAKGATGRKGSLPLSYAQVPTTNIQPGLYQYKPLESRLSQQSLPQNKEAPVGPTQKIVKSHAKYFSQQNSPVSAAISQTIYPQNSSGAGVIQPEQRAVSSQGFHQQQNQ